MRVRVYGASAAFSSFASHDGLFSPLSAYATPPLYFSCHYYAAAALRECATLISARCRAAVTPPLMLLILLATRYYAIVPLIRYVADADSFFDVAPACLFRHAIVMILRIITLDAAPRFSRHAMLSLFSPSFLHDATPRVVAAAFVLIHYFLLCCHDCRFSAERSATELGVAGRVTPIAFIFGRGMPHTKAFLPHWLSRRQR